MNRPGREALIDVDGGEPIRWIALRVLQWFTLIGVGLFTLGPTQVAFAHATLIHSTPADGAVIPAAPATLHLGFSEEVSTRFSSARLLATDGQVLAISPLDVPTAADNTLTWALPDLTPGTYSLLWRVLSEADGHFSQGLLVFGVGDVEQLAATPQVANPSAPAPVEITLRWLNYGFLAGTIGGLALVGMGLPLLPSVHRRLLWFIGWCIGCALLVGLGLLAWQTVALFGSTPEGAWSPSSSWLVISQTRWGMLWLLREGLLVLLLGITLGLIRRPSVQTRWWTALSWVLGLALLITQTLSGHAAGDQRVLLLAVAANTLHMLAASLWVGGLAALLISLWPLMRHADGTLRQQAHGVWRAFGPVAALSVGLLIVSGLYNMGRQVASLDALITTDYGRVLVGKLALMLLAGLLGLLNHRGVRADWLAPIQHWLPTFLRAEVALGGLLLLATALITATPPPRGVEFTLDPAALPSSLSQTVDDLVVTLVVKPNRPGPNVFTVYSASTRRPPPAEILRVLLRFSHLEQAVGTTSVTAQAVEPGRYMLTTHALRLAGAWQIEVVTRRYGLEDSVARFQWVVAPPGAIKPVVLSKQPFAKPLTIASAGGLVVLFVIVIGMRWQSVLPKHNSTYASLD